MEIVYLTMNKNGKYHGEIDRTVGIPSHQSISSEKGIAKIINAYENKIVKGNISRGSMRLYTRDGNIVVIHDYETIPQNSLYQSLFTKKFPVEITRTIPKATGLEVFKNYLKKMGITIHHANNKKVAAVGLTIAIAISIGSFPVMAIQDQVPSSSTTQEKDFMLSKKKLTKNPNNSSTVFNKKSLEQQRQKINYIYQWFQNFNPMVRLDQTAAFQNVEEFSYSEITLGTKIDRAFLEEFYQSSTYSLFVQAAKDYGVDVNLLVAIAYTESRLNHFDLIPGGKLFKKGVTSAVGIMQIQSPQNGRKFSGYNYTTGKEEVIITTMENASDLETNIRLGAMYLQACLKECNQNVFLSIQEYNFGPVAKEAVRVQAKAKGRTFEEQSKEYSDTSFIPWFKAYAASKGGYGNPYYIYDVMSFFSGIYCANRVGENEYIVFNLDTMEYSMHDMEQEWKSFVETTADLKEIRPIIESNKTFAKSSIR